MASVPTVETNDSQTLPNSIQRSSDLPHLIECCSEVNEQPVASQLVVVTWKAIERKDRQGELVVGKDHLIPFYFSDFVERHM